MILLKRSGFILTTKGRNHSIHTEHGMIRLQMETTGAVPGDRGRSPTDET